MFKTLATITASLLFLPWQASVSTDIGRGNAFPFDAVSSISDFHAQPQRLRDELQRHRALASAGGWPVVPPGPTIRPGAEDPRLAILARRLALSDDLPELDAPVSTTDYNVTLQHAVRRFQIRHGLEADGLVGHRTLRALNVSIERRIDQIRVNIERARRLPDMHNGDFVVVNAAAFRAFVIRGGETVWTTKVIVGESDTATPEFQATMNSIVFNPTWTVPRSIARKELLPKIKQDPRFFERGKYQLFDRSGNRVDPASVDWDTMGIDRFTYTLVQQPGPANQLGQIKFMFPNKYSVCMHDTPAKALFANAARAFSHGCIRVDEPLSFAEVVLQSEGWTREQIDSQIDSGRTRAVALSEPLPVLLLYWTAEVDDLGTIHFYDDLYRRDAALLRELDVQE